jgi:hypothetical protein
MVAQIYTQALGCHFIAFYDSQGCGGGILTCLHMGCLTREQIKYSSPGEGKKLKREKALVIIQGM